MVLYLKSNTFALTVSWLKSATALNSGCYMRSGEGTEWEFLQYNDKPFEFILKAASNMKA